MLSRVPRGISLWRQYNKDHPPQGFWSTRGLDSFPIYHQRHFHGRVCQLHRAFWKWCDACKSLEFRPLTILLPNYPVWSRERSLMFYIQNAVLHRWHILIRWWSVLTNNGCSAQSLENGGFNKLYLKWAQEQCSVLFKNTSTHIYLLSLPPHTWNL